MIAVVVRDHIDDLATAGLPEVPFALPKQVGGERFQSFEEQHS